MRKALSKLASFIKKHKTISVVATLTTILLVWWVVSNLVPKPLGDSLEYLGKRDYGCSIGFCDSQPYSIYYYGTDMTEEEIGKYFKGVKYDSSTVEVAGKGYSAETLLFTTAEGDFTIDYYNSNEVFKTAKQHKKHTVSLSDSSYLIAEKHLK